MLNDKRTLKDVLNEIEIIERRMTQLVIQQSDIDTELSNLDRQLLRLEKEKNVYKLA